MSSASASVAASPRHSRSSMAGNDSRPMASSSATPRTKTWRSVVAVMALDHALAREAWPAPWALVGGSHARTGHRATW